MLNSFQSRRIPNAFMLYVKDQKNELMKNCPSESKSVIGSYLGEKWRTLDVEEKKVYFDRYNALKRLESDKPGFAVELNQENRTMMPSTSRTMDVDFLPPDMRNQNISGEKASTSKNLTLEQFANFGFEFKEKPKKKVRRLPNPYMIFAKEHRKNIHASYLKDKKCHISTILGNMWRVLPAAEKKLYTDKARKMHNLRKKSETASSFKPKKKIDSKAKGRKAGRPRRIAPELNPETNITRIQDPINVQKAPLSDNSTSVLESGSPSTSYVNNAYQPTNFSKRSFQVDTHPTQVNCRYNHLPEQPTSTYNAAMSKPCAGAGMVPSIFMPYPFPPFWMYPQMAYQMYLQSLSHPYSWGLPYDYYENSYFSSYCSGRGNNWGTGSSNLHQPTSSVSAGETDNRNESVATRIEEDDLEQELVIVDDDNANEQS